MKYVEWVDTRGTAKGIDTLENFNSWSNKPAVKGRYKIKRKFDSNTEPKGYAKRLTKAELRAKRKAEESVPTPPEAVAPPPEKKEVKPPAETQENKE